MIDLSEVEASRVFFWKLISLTTGLISSIGCFDSLAAGEELNEPNADEKQCDGNKV